LPAGTKGAKLSAGEAQRFEVGRDIPGEWWAVFHSPALDALIKEALETSPNIVAAEAALRQARELRKAGEGAFWPLVQAGFNASRNKTQASLAPVAATGALYYNLYTSQLGVTYVPDVFGGTRRTVESLEAQEAVQRFQLEAAYLALTSGLVGAALGEAGLPLVGDPRRGIFRIYRDVRFSPDKRLYKTHAGAVLTRSGSKRDPGLLYLHVAPGESMVAAGFWHPEPGLLSRLRRAILHDPDEFLAIKDRLIAAGHPISSGERLSRPPPRLRRRQGPPRRRICLLEVVHCPCRAERCRDAVARTGRQHRRFRPHRSAAARMGLGGGR